jgi:hypothetical protein
MLTQTYASSFEATFLEPLAMADIISLRATVGHLVAFRMNNREELLVVTGFESNTRLHLEYQDPNNHLPLQERSTEPTPQSFIYRAVDLHLFTKFKLCTMDYRIHMTSIIDAWTALRDHWFEGKHLSMSGLPMVLHIIVLFLYISSIKYSI